MHFSLLPRPASPAEKLEKQILHEGKEEDNAVKHELKELANLQKDAQKSLKDLEKAQHTLAKRQKEEHTAATALNKATHAHDVSVVKLHDAESDLKLKQDRETQLHTELATKREHVDQLVSTQKQHNEERESRLTGIRDERTARQSTGEHPGPSAAEQTTTSAEATTEPQSTDEPVRGDSTGQEAVNSGHKHENTAASVPESTPVPVGLS